MNMNRLTIVKDRGVTTSDKQPMANPVGDLWDIELFYGKHPNYTELTYSVNFMSLLEGRASKCFLVIELREQFDIFLRDLNVFGCMEKAEFHKAIDYVKYLKINGLFKRVPNLLSVMEGKASADESNELFSMVEDCILNNLEAFPTVSSDEYRPGECFGVILDTEQYVEKYGVNAVGVTSDALIEFLNLEGESKIIRLLEIARGWRDQELLLHFTKQARLQEPIKPNVTSKAVKRFYIFRVNGLSTL
ncbi:hypothetical protein C162_00245 [Paenibacillus sp. FSL R7-269]|uniref:hypothetical protein n=1 Tax=Paenibacillus sp. FSL R7-269 TaxID=1226755 RepID=UPI0003E24EE0|nr:hypothetical protein [Paenibacillus sp. FSL R7-269]ETT56795.1 hypothetical protein C162_00245 [Paenibacillus sp. FSL R7-269]